MISKMLLILFSFSLIVQCASPFFYPSHASCKIHWKFGINCSLVASSIEKQIKKWSNDNCGSGERCLYKFQCFENNVLRATHKTPKAHYVDDLSFNFTDAGSACSVEGFSTSETWYAYLDYGTNYCNLHNLIDGAGLTKVKDYNEMTSNALCTQFTSKNCEKY